MSRTSSSNGPAQASARVQLKSDIFGRVECADDGNGPRVLRVACGSRVPGTRIGARVLAANEHRALRRLCGLAFVPRAEGRIGAATFARSWLPGIVLHHADPPPASFFDRLVERIASVHAAGVVHNDLAKEANILVLEDGTPGVIDFQVALTFGPSRRPRWLFDLLCREDMRHALKHKARYRPDQLTDDDRHRLGRRSWPVALWSRTLMRPYQRLVIRLGWEPPRGPAGR